MKIKFDTRWGKNTINIPINGDSDNGIKVRFDGKWGTNIIDIPIGEEPGNYQGISRLKDKTFTIINRIPESSKSPKIAEWKKYTLTGCDMQSGIFDRTSQTMTYRANTWTAWIGDWWHYREPDWLDGGYYALNDKTLYYTANAGDLLIFSDIPDNAPKSEQEFQALVTKYKNAGGILSSVQAFINYKPNGTPWRTNHIEIVKEG